MKDPELAKLFDINGNAKADLIGCDRSWACAEAIERHIFAYRLKDTVEHVQQSYIAAVKLLRTF
ncbi:MAG: hypothetical protein AAFY57_07015 [Cyanobacteria bacterium J06642_2]